MARLIAVTKAIEKRFLRRGDLMMRIVLAFCFVILFASSVFAFDDPCEGGNREPSKFASSLPVLPTNELSKMRFEVKETDAQFEVVMRAGGNIITRRFYRRPNPIEENLEMQPINVGGYGGIFLNYLSGAAGRMQCPYIIFPSSRTARFHSLPIPGPQVNVQDIDSNGETEVISHEYDENADCFSKAETPTWHRIYHVNPRMESLDDVSREFPNYYRTLAQEYRRLLNELAQKSINAPECSRALRDLVRRADELGRRTTTGVTRESPSGLGVASRRQPSSSEEPKYFVRLLNCDDRCSVGIGDARALPMANNWWNGLSKLADAEFGQDSGWIEFTDTLQPGKNLVRFAVFNFSGGITYGFQIKKDDEVVFSEVCGRAGTFGCDQNRPFPTGPVKQFSYEISSRGSVAYDGWLAFWPVFQSAVNKRDRVALRSMISPSYNEGMTPDQVLRSLDRGRGWQRLQQAVASGTHRADLSPNGRAQRSTGGWGYYFEYGRDGRWRWFGENVGD